MELSNYIWLCVAVVPVMLILTRLMILTLKCTSYLIRINYTTVILWAVICCSFMAYMVVEIFI